jgi:lipoate-protein ligase A
MLTYDHDCNLHKEIPAVVRDYLISRGINAEYHAGGNDVMIDGKYKVLGANKNTYSFGKLCFVGATISFNVNLKLIQKICRKPMHKIPVGLEEYGVTPQEIKEIVLNYVKEKYLPGMEWKPGKEMKFKKWKARVNN